ncbi:MAG: SPASM domain-containing protein, partial [bacterium]
GAVSPHGDVMPCVSMPLPVGNLMEKPFKQIWRDSPELERIRNTTPEDVECGDCRLNNACVKCMAYGYMDRGNFPYLSPEICRVGSFSQGGRLYGKAI